MGSQALEGTRRASQELGVMEQSATIQKAAELAGSAGWAAKDTMSMGRDVLFVLPALVAQGFFFYLKLRVLVLVLAVLGERERVVFCLA